MKFGVPSTQGKDEKDEFYRYLFLVFRSSFLVCFCRLLQLYHVDLDIYVEADIFNFCFGFKVVRDISCSLYVVCSYSIALCSSCSYHGKLLVSEHTEVCQTDGTSKRSPHSSEGSPSIPLLISDNLKRVTSTLFYHNVQEDPCKIQWDREEKMRKPQ